MASNKIKYKLNNNGYKQTSFFDFETSFNKSNDAKLEKELDNNYINPTYLNFENYNIDSYKSDVGKYGLSNVWNAILDYSLKNKSKENSILSIENFGNLYEIGLAEKDKTLKKELGQYYTPEDVSELMANWLRDLEGENICDVGCGTGNLIISYLNIIGEEKAKKLLNGGKIYLYDYDEIALKIAKYSIAIIYGSEYLEKINAIYGDFLDKAIKLPPNSKVITNPPYAKISEMKNTWDVTENLLSSKDLYSAFIEKILLNNSQAVIISPYSFLGGNKFYPLRSLLNNYNGFIVSFDNVPGNIFKGKKHGVFNTNTANSVRAAITVVKNDTGEKGFRLSHLIRFKTEERERLLDNEFLETLLSDKRQIVNDKNRSYVKCHKELENTFDIWLEKSSKKVGDLLSKTESEYPLYIPNTCRYFTTASVRELNRTGLITLYAKDEFSYDFLYCLINSSFAYWWWRIFDGGINYPIGLLHEIPVFYDVLSKKDRESINSIRKNMSLKEKDFMVTKLNAGKEQENIKFPKNYRDEINSIFFKILNCTDDPSLFNLVHSNRIFGLEEDEDND